MQLAFDFPQRREIGHYEASWREGAVTVRRIVGAHSIDLSWIWLTFSVPCSTRER
jgi:hypothetical protein